MILRIFSFSIAAIAFYSVIGIVNAQSALNVAPSYPVVGADIRKGMLVSSTPDVLTLTNIEYDPNIFGVITENVAITIAKKNETTSYPIALNGTVEVIVSTSNGQIEKGDFITSSSIPGIGMKATKPGRVIGIAVENSREQTTEYDLVSVAINREIASAKDIYRVGDLVGNMADYEESPFGDSEDEPKLLSAVKYISSGAIVIIAFAGGIIYYIQISKQEVEALGRNPLASKIIQKNMIFHAIVVALICLGGLIMAYSVLQL